MGEMEPVFSTDLGASWCEVFHSDKAEWICVKVPDDNGQLPALRCYI